MIREIGLRVRTERGPVAHLYVLAADGHYELYQSVRPDEAVKTELPFPVQVAPADWLS